MRKSPACNDILKDLIYAKIEAKLKALGSLGTEEAYDYEVLEIKAVIQIKGVKNVQLFVEIPL